MSYSLSFAKISTVVAAIASLASAQAFGAEIDKDLAAKLAPKFALIKTWAANKTIVDAVKQHNTSPSAEAKAMNQEKWKKAAVLDPFVRGLTKNPAAEAVKAEAKKDESATEAFVSGADGCKVAFLAKTSGWCHKGKGKHDVPMTGKDWTGEVEIDESTGTQQIQIAVPVLDAGKTIGSLVVGFATSKLKK